MKKRANSVESWIEKAEDDFALAKVTLQETKFYAHVCLLCEQALEKYLKAFLVQNKSRPAQTHNLNALAKVCKKHGLNLSGFDEDLRVLSEYYIPAKYPVEVRVEFNRQMAEEALTITKKIRKVIKNHLE